MLPKLKKEYSNWGELNSKAIQTIATELFGSYRSFFNLIKKDKSTRPPKKIENKNYHTITWNQSGWIIKNNNEIIINKITFRYKTNLNIKEYNIKDLSKETHICV